MGGAGIEVSFDSEYQTIIDALARASAPVLLQIATEGGLALENVKDKAFDNKADPVTGAKWAAKADGSEATLYRRGALRRSVISNAFPDGSVILGSNLVYAGIHQEGGQAGRKKKSKIPARPFMGVPRDFERQFFDDPAIQKALGIAAGGGS
jgi:phage virion morphogenesis protein